MKRLLSAAATLLLAGDSSAARTAFHEAGKSLVGARLALASGDSAAARVRSRSTAAPSRTE